MKPIRFPGESKEYRDARNDLLKKEMAARRAIEAAAAARRRLPLGGPIPQDYVFEEYLPDRTVRKIKLSELMSEKLPTLAIYSYMYGPEKAQPCPMCTPLLDTLDGAEFHIRRRLNLVIVAESPAKRLYDMARSRGWINLRLLSTAGSSYNQDYFGKDENGEDSTFLNVFRRVDNRVHHFWGTEMVYGKTDGEQHHRALDLLNPIYAAFDLTPEGRGDYFTDTEYGDGREAKIGIRPY